MAGGRFPSTQPARKFTHRRLGHARRRTQGVTMATPRFAWGIDVGNRALKAIRLSHSAEIGVRIDDYEVIEHEQVLSNSGDNRETLLQNALTSFVQHHDLGNAPVAVGVSGQSSFARFIK